jgi:signal transduction histidine kinase/serine phosphatase RsbU (regulator of sigma subunit)
MEPLYLYQVSVSILTQTILAAAITLYLLSIHHKSRPTWLFAANSGGFTVGSFMAFLSHSVDVSSPWHFYTVRLEPLGLLIGQIALLQFVYQFPKSTSKQRLEARIVLIVSIIAALIGIGWTAYGLVLFEEVDSLAVADSLVGMGFLWVIVVMLRQTVRLSEAEERSTTAKDLQDQSGPSWPVKLLNPQGRHAKAARALALAYLFSLALITLAILGDVGLVPAMLVNLTVAPGILLSLFIYVIVYLNHSIDASSFMVKLVGVSLVTMLAFLGITGYLIAPYYEAAYRNETLIESGQTIRFEPNSAGGYGVASVPFSFDPDLGQKLQPDDHHSTAIVLDTAFPFFNRPRNVIYVSDNGFITFDEDYDGAAFQYRRQPTIAPLVVKMDPAGGGGVFAKTDADRVTITWNELPETDGESTNTVQLVLRQDGAFDIIYEAINQNPTYQVFDWMNAPWFMGVLPGGGEGPPARLRFASNLPHHDPNPGGLVEDFYANYRHYLHRRVAPLAILVLAACLIILGGFPLFFQTSLVKPLNSLVAGVSQVNAGNLGLALPVEFNDEIGFLTRSFNGMVRSIRRADQLKDEFLANTSHELRTPLNGIIGLAESMVDGATGPLTTQQQNNLAMIVSAGRRLDSLVNDILDFSRLKNEGLALQLKPVDLNSLVYVVLTLSLPLVGRKGLTLRNEVAPDLPPVLADENRLQQIMHNLIGNAVKFTHTGQVTVSAQPHGDQLAITVADTGIGIPADRLEDIFKSFEQADGSTAREYGGTGLGLPISRQLIELHGGQIWVESEVGHGSRFTFTLNPAPETVAAEPASGPATTAAGTLLTSLDPVPGGGDAPALAALSAPDQCRILIVDDEPVNLQVLTNYLSLKNHSVTQAISGAEALATLEKASRFDLVVLDIMMPQMSGYEVCNRIRERYSLSELPVLMLTAKNQPKDVVVGFESGANDYLAKPIDKNELLARINTLLTLGQAVKAQNELLVIQKELDIARRIQESLLPHPEFDWSGPDTVCYSTAARDVGGDFYAYYSAHGSDGRQRFRIAIGDVSGKGMPAALLMAVSLASFQSTVVQTVPPAQVLNHLNQVIFSYTRNTRQNCALICLEFVPYDGSTPGNGSEYVLWGLRAANAGCIAPLIRSVDGSVTWLDVSGLPLGAGLAPDFNYQEANLNLSPGDVVVLTSDGVVEATDANGRMFGFERLERAVGAGPTTSAEAMSTYLRAEVDAFVGNVEPHDDLTIVVVQV